MLQRLTVLLLICSCALAGCTSIIHATTDQPIQPDPTDTSLDTDIEYKESTPGPRTRPRQYKRLQRRHSP